MDDLNIQAGVTVNAEQAERAFTALGDKAQKMANEVTKAADKAGKATDGIGDGAEKGADKFTRAESRMRSAIQKSTRELEMLGKTASQKFEAQLEFKGLDKAKFQPFLDELRKTEEAAAKARDGISGIGDAARVAGSMMAAAFSGAALLGMVGKVVAVQREFDVLNSSLKTVTGSSAAAEREMAWLKDFAKETPFGLAQATQGFVKMKALGLDPTRAALTSFGNTASAMGKDLNQMIEAVADASTGEFERLKEFGIKAKKEGDQVSLTFQGVTTTIKNSAADITKYLENIGNTSFGGAMEERAKTLDGTIAALGDTWDELFRTVSQNNVGSLIFDSVTLANGALEDATTLLRALGGAAQDASRDTGALSTIQTGIATVFETVAVLGANLKYVLVQIGNEIGGLAAQVVQAAQFNFAGVRAIREQMVADAEAARREVDATTERILNARKEQEEYARWATRNASAATDPRRVDLGGGTTRAAGGASSGAAKAAKEAISEYDKLIKKLSDELPAASAAAEAAQMGYNKAQTEFLALAASPAWAKFTNDQRATVAALFANKIAIEQSADAAKTLAKANIDAAASREKYIASLLSGLDKIKADTAAQIEATARLGLSKEAIAELDAAKLEMLATDLELQAIKAMDRNLDEQTYSALKQQAEAYRELAEAKKAGAAKEMALNLEKANQDAARDADRDWKRAAADINRSLTDALLRGFESGKGFAKNLRDTIKNMFSTLVLRPVISAVMTPVSGMVNGLVQGGMNAVGLGGGGNLMGMASNASSMYSAASSFNTGWFTNFGATAPASLYSSGAQLYSQGFETIGSGMMDLGNSMAQYSQAINTAGSWLGYGKAMYDLTQGNYGSSVGTAIGTYFGGPIGSAIGSFVGGLVDKWTGSRGANHSGGVYSTATPDRMAAAAGLGLSGGALGDFTQRGNTAIDAQLGAAVGALSSVYQGLAKYAGDSAKQIDIVAGFAVNGKYKDEDAYGYFKLLDKLTGEELASYAKRDGGLGNDPEKAWAQYITDMGSALVGEIRKADIPKWMDNIFAGLGDKITTEGLSSALQQIAKIDSAFALLGNNIEYLADISGATQTALLELSGGIDALMANAGAYYENFYSADEQRAAVQRQLQKAFDGLNLKLPDIDAADARAQFRALAEAQDLSTEAGRKTYAALLQLSGAFAGITQSAEDAAAAAKQLAEEQERAREDAIRSASDLLRRAIDRDRDALQDQASGMQDVINALSASVSTLKNNARELYGQVDGTAQMLAAQGMVYIEQALGGVRAGASITDYTGLTDAISAARGGINTGAYASQFERERDALVLAGQLSELGDLGDLQLSIEERQLKALTAQIDALDALAQRADDLINGTTALTGTVQSYFDQLLKLLNPEKPEEAEKKTGGVFAIGGSATGGGGDSGTPYDKDAAVRYTVGAQLKYGADKGLSHDDPAVLKAINAAVYGTGITQDDIAKAYGVPEDDIARLFAGVGLPKFDVGTNRVPRTGLAVVHEGEAIVPKAYNPWAGGQSMGGNAEMVAELRALREEVAQLRAVSQATASSTAQMAEQLDQVTEGGNAMRTEAIA